MMQDIPDTEDWRTGILQQEIFLVFGGWYQKYLHSVPTFVKPGEACMEK